MAAPHRRPGERSFGLSVGPVCLGLAAVAWWRVYPTLSTVLLVVGTLLVVFALVAPRALRLPNRVWWRFAQALGWVNARILLSLFYAVVLTPVGAAMRLFGWNPLKAAAESTNWRPYPARRGDTRHYERMY